MHPFLAQFSEPVWSGHLPSWADFITTTSGFRFSVHTPLDPWVTRMRNGIAHAHFFLGRYDEAASWAVMALQDNPDYLPALRQAAASNALAGRPEQAHQAVARLRQVNPALRVSTLKDVVGPYRRAEDLSRFEEGLRQAGLPE
jgi:tetratricopeptide (TPR) repeat protein